MPDPAHLAADEPITIGDGTPLDLNWAMPDATLIADPGDASLIARFQKPPQRAVTEVLINGDPSIIQYQTGSQLDLFVEYRLHGAPYVVHAFTGTTGAGLEINLLHSAAPQHGFQQTPAVMEILSVDRPTKHPVDAEIKRVRKGAGPPRVASPGDHPVRVVIKLAV